MAKRVVKKRRIRVIPFLVLILVISVTSFLISLYLKQPIKNIIIYNNNYVEDHEIIKLSNLKDYPSFYKVSNKKIKTSIMKNPIIKDVVVKRKFYKKIEITVEEYDVLFKLAKNDNYVLSGNIEKKLDYDIIVPTLINYVPNSKYKSLIKNLEKTNKDVLYKISEIKYEPTKLDEDRFLFIMSDNNLVYITLTKFNKLNYYNDALKELNNHKGIFHFDSGNHFEIIK